MSIYSHILDSSAVGPTSNIPAGWLGSAVPNKEISTKDEDLFNGEDFFSLMCFGRSACSVVGEPASSVSASVCWCMCGLSACVRARVRCLYLQQEVLVSHRRSSVTVSCHDRSGPSL